MAFRRKRKTGEDRIRHEEPTPSFEFAGGFLPEDDPMDSKKKRSADGDIPFDDGKDVDDLASSSLFHDTGCTHCGREYFSSYLQEHFDITVCDPCRNRQAETEENRYALITRTEARETYMLKDEDFDLRQPKLKFISRKNPHNPRWGDMKLYCLDQVKTRALLVHESFERIEELKKQRYEKNSAMQAKKRAKQLKEMKRAIRQQASSATLTSQPDSHVHEFGAEMHDKKNDNYYTTCKVCQFRNVYDKL